nr:hypothetical protein BaRGS_016890 [Batillaria attramentaria]
MRVIRVRVRVGFSSRRFEPIHEIGRGKVLASSSDSSGQIRYKFDEVGCQDAGVIHCAPSFEGRDVKEFELKAGQTSELRFQVRMHSTDVRKVPAVHDDFTNACDLSGTPPDLTLSVVFESPKEEDDGHWRVEMINDIGPDILDFYLDIVSGPENKTRAVPDVAVASSAGGVNMIAIAGVNVTTVVVVVIIVLIIVSVRRSRRESRSHQDPERLDVQVAFQPGPAAAERDNEDDENSNPYDVVQGTT